MIQIYFSESPRGLTADVGGQHCPDSVWIYCAVSVGQNQVQIRNPDTRKPSRLKISDFDGQTPYSKPGQNPDSAFRRRLGWRPLRGHPTLSTNIIDL